MGEGPDRACPWRRVRPETATDVDRRLVAWLTYVYDTNIALLHARDPDLGIDAIDLVVATNVRPNAAARQVGNWRAVIVCLGLLRRLWQSVSAAAHHPEGLSRAHPHNVSDPAWKSYADGCPIPFEDWEVSGDRADYFLDIFMMMLDYVTSRELAHLLRRHTELAFLADGTGCLDEAGALLGVSTGFPDMVLQDVEFDADAYGLNQMLHGTDQKFPFGTWGAAEALEYGFQIAFGQILVMQTFNKGGRDLDAPADRHPSPLFRAMNFSNLDFRSLHDLVPGAWERSVEMHDAAWFEASELARDLGRCNDRWYGDAHSDADRQKFLESEARYFAASAPGRSPRRRRR